MSCCPTCAADDLIQIDLSAAGKLMRFSSCRRCEHRWWIDPVAADTISLQDVLSVVAAV